MAEDKKSILVYADWINIFEELEDVEAGKLIKHFFRYVNDVNPDPPDRLTKLLFEPIKQTLKRDLKKYEQKREINRQNAKIRWDKINAGACERIPVDANHADSDSDSDSVSVSVSDNVKEKKKKYAPFVLLLDSEFLKLKETYSEDYAKKSIEKLNNYKGSTGKKYKSDYLTILNWVIGEVLKENGQGKKNDVFAKYGVK